MILKVKQNENPYDVIGNYIEKHILVIDDIIAVILIDGEIRNELLLVDGEIGSTNNFVWQIDWWEGEENVELIDFFFVSDACKNNNNNDLISREQAMDAMAELQGRASTKAELKGISKAWKLIKKLPPIQPEPQYKTNYGFMWLCPKCGLPIHSDYTRCVRCGHNREKGA